jgi:hypothetical protein
MIPPAAEVQRRLAEARHAERTLRSLLRLAVRAERGPTPEQYRRREGGAA